MGILSTGSACKVKEHLNAALSNKYTSLLSFSITMLRAVNNSGDLVPTLGDHWFRTRDVPSG